MVYFWQKFKKIKTYSYRHLQYRGQHVFIFLNFCKKYATFEEKNYTALRDLRGNKSGWEGNLQRAVMPYVIKFVFFCRNWSIYIYILVIVKEKVSFDKKYKFWNSTSTGTGSYTKAPNVSYTLLGFNLI